MTAHPIITATCRARSTPEEAFDAFTRPDQVTAWFAATDAEIDARPGGSWRFRYAPSRYSSGTFAELRRPERIVLHWHEWHEDANGQPRPGEDTSVISTCTLTFTPERSHTRIDVVQEGYPDSPEWHDFAAALSGGWESQLQSLKQYLEDQS